MTASTESAVGETDGGLDEIGTELARIASAVLTSDEFRHVVAEIERVTRRSERSSTVVQVIGQPGTGKSTLVNDLLGEPLLATGVGETTVIGMDEVAAYAAYETAGDVIKSVAAVEIGLPHQLLEGGLTLRDDAGDGGLLTVDGEQLGRFDGDAVVLVSRGDSELRRSEVDALTAAVRTVTQAACVITHTDVCSNWREILRRDREIIRDTGLDIEVRWFVNQPGASGDGCGGLDELREFLGSELPGRYEQWRGENTRKALGGIAWHIEAACVARLADLDPSVPAAAKLRTIEEETWAFAALRRKLDTAHRVERRQLRERLTDQLQRGIRRIRHRTEASLAQPKLPGFEQVVDQINSDVIRLWIELAAAAPREAAATAEILGRAADTTMGTWSVDDFAGLQPSAIEPVASGHHDSLLGDILEFAPIGTAGWIYRMVLVATGVPGLGFIVALGAAGAILHRRHYRMQTTVLRRDVAHYLSLRLDETQSAAIRAIDAYIDAAEARILDVIGASLNGREAELVRRKAAFTRALRADEAATAQDRAVLRRELAAVQALRKRLE